MEAQATIELYSRYVTILCFVYHGSQAARPRLLGERLNKLPAGPPPAMALGHMQFPYPQAPVPMMRFGQDNSHALPGRVGAEGKTTSRHFLVLRQRLCIQVVIPLAVRYW